VPDYYTLQRKRNLTVGIFVVIGVCALFFLILKFQDLPLFVTQAKSYTVKVQFPSAPGVSKSTPIRFCGYEVGRVTSVNYPQLRRDIYDPNLEYHQTLVLMAIDKKFKDIPSNVHIRIMKRGLGSSYIEMIADPKKLPMPIDPNSPETAFLGPKLPILQGTVGQASEFFPEETQKKADELINRFNDLLANANLIIGDQQNRQSIKGLLVNAESAAAQATETLKEIQNFSSSGKTTIAKADTEITRIATAIETASQEFAMTLHELQIVLKKADSGDGTAAKFINDGRFYENLVDSSQELRLALEQLRKLITESRDKGLPIKLK
jgi:ABC-type transporter Mla subunit MlaD